MKFELIQGQLLKEAEIRRAKAGTKGSGSKSYRKLIGQAEGIELAMKLMRQIINSHYANPLQEKVKT